jgi:hypothetical protein
LDKLDLILQKLESLDELKQITISLRHGQEVTHSKLDASGSNPAQVIRRTV